MGGLVPSQSAGAAPSPQRLRPGWRSRRPERSSAPTPSPREIRSMPDPVSDMATICGSITSYFGVERSGTATSRRPVVSDDHAGLKAARQAVMPGVPWQRCQFHAIQNAMAHVPEVALRTEAARDHRRAEQVRNEPSAGKEHEPDPGQKRDGIGDLEEALRHQKTFSSKGQRQHRLCPLLRALSPAWVYFRERGCGGGAGTTNSWTELARGRSSSRS